MVRLMTFPRQVTDCFGAVEFWSSPDQGPGAIWNYTIWQDSVIKGADVRKDNNGPQIYTLPLQREVDSLISQRNNGSRLTGTVLQYPFTSQTQEQVDFADRKFYGLLVTQALGFAFFLAICGIAYHLTGHVVRQREEGMLPLIDAQMPNASRWECLAARTLATHVAFDLIYTPAYIVCGAVVGTVVYPHSNAGWFVLLYLMAGLAMTSFSILASSLFRRQQLSAISAIVAAIAFAIVAQFSQSGQKSTNTAAVSQPQLCRGDKLKMLRRPQQGCSSRQAVSYTSSSQAQSLKFSASLSGHIKSSRLCCAPRWAYTYGALHQLIF